MLLLDRGVSPRTERLVTEYAKWIGVHLNTRADLTLRCRAMMRLLNDRRVSMVLNEDFLRATVVRALNRMNGYALGIQRARAQARLDALVWSERGAIARRPHVHALIERPPLLGEDEFRHMIERAWRAQPFAYHEAKIQPVHDLERSIGYNAKASTTVSGHLVYFHKERPESAWWR